MPADVTAYALLERGRAEEMVGQVEQALETYRSAISWYVGMPSQHEVLAHLRLSFLHMYRLHEIDVARREAIVRALRKPTPSWAIWNQWPGIIRARQSLHAAEAALDQYDDLATRSRLCTLLEHGLWELGDFTRALWVIWTKGSNATAGAETRVGPLYLRLNRAGRSRS